MTESKKNIHMLTADQLKFAKLYLKMHPSILPLADTLYLNHKAESNPKITNIIQNDAYFWDISKPETVLMGVVGSRPLFLDKGDIVSISIMGTLAALEKLGWSFMVSSPDINSDNCYSFVCYNRKYDLTLMPDSHDISMTSMYDVLSGIISCLLIENTEWLNVLTGDE